MIHLLSLRLGNIVGIGPLGNTSSTTPNATTVVSFVSVISKIIGILTIAGALWFVFQIFAGAFGWIAAGHDKQSLDNSKKRITNAVIGLFILIASYTLIAVVGSIFGIDIINLESLIINSAAQ